MRISFVPAFIYSRFALLLFIVTLLAGLGFAFPAHAQSDNNTATTTFTALPASGTAPHTVTITSLYGDDSSYRPSIADGRDTMLSYGDGSQKVWLQCASAQTNNSTSTGSRICNTAITLTHTYQQSGTYVIRLTREGGMCQSGACAPSVVLERTITVSATTTATSSTGISEERFFELFWKAFEQVFESMFKPFIDLFNLILGNTDPDDEDYVDFDDIDIDVVPRSGDKFKKDDIKSLVVNTYENSSCETAGASSNQDGHIVTYRISFTGKVKGTNVTTEERIVRTICSDEDSDDEMEILADIAVDLQKNLSFGNVTANDLEPIAEFIHEGDDDNDSDNDSDNYFKAEPTTGVAPLTVKFATRYGDMTSVQPSTIDGRDTRLAYGDGSVVAWIQCPTVTGYQPGEMGRVCTTPLNYTHTYTQPGTYVARIVRQGSNCPGGCTASVVAEQTIRVLSASSTATTTPVTESDEIHFEVKVTDKSGNIVKNWTKDDISIGKEHQLEFRWNAPTYERCLPFLGDNGQYSFLHGRGSNMISGNTEMFNFNVREFAGAYFVECDGEEGSDIVDRAVINVSIDGANNATGTPYTLTDGTLINKDDPKQKAVYDAYMNYLKRKPEPEGFWYWVSKYDELVKTTTLEKVFTDIAEEHNFWYSYTLSDGSVIDKNDPREVEIYYAYLTYLQRKPEPAGFYYWVAHYDEVYETTTIAEVFQDSDEYEAWFSGDND